PNVTEKIAVRTSPNTPLARNPPTTIAAARAICLFESADMKTPTYGAPLYSQCRFAVSGKIEPTGQDLNRKVRLQARPNPARPRAQLQRAVLPARCGQP